VSQTITVNDETPPIFVDVPTGGTVECADDAVFTEPTVNDNCDGMITFTFDDVTTGDDCSGSVTRTWTATDVCGNSATASATISYEDTEAPMASNVPVDTTIDCTATVVFGDDPSWTDNCDDDVFSSFEDVTIPGDCEGSFTITRFWSAIDECDNLAVVSQTITVVDNTAPVFTFVPGDDTQACGNDPQFGMPMAEDDCSGVSITQEDEMTGNGCAGSVTRTWTATDSCGNASTASATITFSDNEPPIFTFVPGTPDVDCDNIPDWEEPVAEDNCGTVTLSFTETISGALCDDGYAWKRQWTATDACGNTAEVETVIWVNPDRTGPVFGFIPGDSLITCDQFPPTFVEPEVTDACSSVEVSFIDEFVIGGPNSCANGESFDYRRVWTATDSCGNTTTAKQTFWVVPVDSTMNVSGQLITEENEYLEGATVMAAGSSVTMDDITEADGAYSFDLPAGFNYEIVPELDANPLNGVSTMDLIVMSKHILGMELMDSPYKLIAADVNNSGTITAYDMVELRKLILFIDTEFQSNTSWRFVDEMFVFPNPMNPWATTFPETYSINGLSADEIADFIAIKVGDVNGSATANALAAGETRDQLDVLNLAIDDQQLTAGETYEVAVKAKDFRAIQGYQFTLNFDAGLLEFVDVQQGVLAQLSADNFGFGQLRQGAITASWNNREAVDLADDAVLFKLIFAAKNNTTWSKALSVNSRFTAAEAYNHEAEQMDLELVFQTEQGQTNAAFALYQNRPNPFKDQSIIGFVLPESSSATLSIYDVSGRMLRSITGDFAKGYNEININRSELNAAGVLYYQLDTPNHSATKKMIVIE
ncbi:MAG: cohesin domain-containing protein, partial [Bacteroidota bacterium]